MSSTDFIPFSLQIAVMLACALVFGELMCKLGQPAVLGEMLGGIVLGPTVFGALAPTFYNGLFQSSSAVGSARDAAIKLGMLFFLFIAGLEVNLSDLQRIGRRTVMIGIRNESGKFGQSGAGTDSHDKVIDERIFVAIVVMAILTSLMSGPAIKQLILKSGMQTTEHFPAES